MKEVFNKLLENSISPNGYYVLFCISNNIVPKHSVCKELEVKRLQIDEWLTEKNELTSKAIILLKEIEAFFKASKKKTSKLLLGDTFEEKIEEYSNIFPKFKLPSGKYARSNKKNLENNFRWFFDTHQYDWETILLATEKYVMEFELTNYKYMRTSQYFIRKMAIDKSYDSELATYCDVVINGDEDFNSSNHFSENVI
jgi:hypothetical protein